ncbi:MAG TPA: Hsp20/alpha crystallin family protein [Syntrophales bacterium]|nr:Hsp20/alpha crystallin family protein [Syntrophales bacterium]HRR46719.1 Hsp20/alpha crystallin family protein [Syntrophales bacterium]HRU88252.1 Hsp20/alpha crystallin family protein [Syntrophales bacterium]
MLDDMFHIAGPTFTLCEHTWRPHADIYETADAIIVILDLAGVVREDIHLEVSRKTIKISGKRDQHYLSGTTRYHLAEIPYGYFERHLALHAPVDSETVQATYANGLLEVRLEKIPPDRERRITVLGPAGGES